MTSRINASNDNSTKNGSGSSIFPPLHEQNDQQQFHPLRAHLPHPLRSAALHPTMHPHHPTGTTMPLPPPTHPHSPLPPPLPLPPLLPHLPPPMHPHSPFHPLIQACFPHLQFLLRQTMPFAPFFLPWLPTNALLLMNAAAATLAHHTHQARSIRTTSTTTAAPAAMTPTSATEPTVVRKKLTKLSIESIIGTPKPMILDEQMEEEQKEEDGGREEKEEEDDEVMTKEEEAEEKPVLTHQQHQQRQPSSSRYRLCKTTGREKGVVTTKKCSIKNFGLSPEERAQIRAINENTATESSATTSTSNNNSNGFACHRCGKVFSYAYYRDKHLKFTPCVDNGQRRFPCSRCPRSFEKRDRLRIHVLHVHEQYRPHRCPLCDKAFSQSSSLNKHLRTHSGERPYQCPHCEKAFTASSILRTHIRQHSGEKPFKCVHCGKCFASHAAHDSHLRRSHHQQQQQTVTACAQ